MAVIYNEKDKTFTLQTENSTYQMKAQESGLLLHTYYGARIDETDKAYLLYFEDRGFSGNPHDIGTHNRRYSQDILPQEYSCFGTGDYRESALKVQNADGSRAVSLRYSGYEIRKGKYAIPGLPAMYADETQADTLVITLKDDAAGIQAHLHYGVLEKADVITRCVQLENTGSCGVKLEKAASMSLDWQYGAYDMITFYGKHAMEREYQRKEIPHGCLCVGSVRGASSHQYNPFVMICAKDATEEKGDCYGFSFVYSGEFLAEAAMDQVDQTRFVMGIHPDDFCWNLLPGESFYTPEVMMAFSEGGTGEVSRIFHRGIREHVCRGEWKDKRRPVLINNWEATYFDFTGDKLAAIAGDAAKLGIELFVMDDGWFGKREDDNSGLGDWFPNEKKLGCTLKELGDKIKAAGISFGIWLEPECISEDSELYRSHPEWAVQIPGRAPQLSRNQLVLDLSRSDVQNYLLERISDILNSAPISYVKWDFNRSVCDKYSHKLPAQAQGEMSHRFVLGLYRVQEELLTRFPHVLFEGCSGGGGRFDVGMLYYTPQIWCSDDTDALERLKIQYGTSYGYPVSAVGAHVSACPNHQTGRTTPLSTRGVVAMSGTFGYELDVNKMTSDEKKEVKIQIDLFKKYYDILQRGDYYRLTSPYESSCVVWEMAAKDGREAVVNLVYQRVCANAAPVMIRLRGLNAGETYCIQLEAVNGGSVPTDWKDDKMITGASLMKCGLPMPRALTEYQAWMLYLKKC